MLWRQNITHLENMEKKKKDFFASGFDFAGREFLQCPDANTNNCPDSTRNKPRFNKEQGKKKKKKHQPKLNKKEEKKNASEKI